MGDLYGYAAYLMYRKLLCLDGWLAGWLAGPCLVYIYISYTISFTKG